MRPQYTLRLTMSFADHPFSLPDAWNKRIERPMTGSAYVGLPDRRELPGIGVPGSVCVRPLQNARNASVRYIEGRCVGPTKASGTIVRGSAFDQATRMLLLAMVRAVSRNRQTGRTAWLRKLCSSVKALLFLA
jgi:hypothetical protein